ncbi:MAG: alpha/beta hydrolase [Deltaproteobacteria bacterium]|nr:alpha/beta hydrolase [Deltaproteobacteria bacterium]
MTESPGVFDEFSNNSEIPMSNRHPPQGFNFGSGLFKGLFSWAGLVYPRIRSVTNSFGTNPACILGPFFCPDSMEDFMPIPNIVLVHGGGSHGAVWNPVTMRLEALGRKVFHPDLSLPESSTLQDHGEQIVQVLSVAAADQPVVLTGHSYGGLVVAEAARQRPGLVKAMVFLDAAVPQLGKSLFDLLGLSGLDPRKDFGLEALHPYTAPSMVDMAALNDIPKLYVWCVKSDFAAVTRQAFEAARNAVPAARWRVMTLDSGHFAMTERPDEVAALLLEM